MTFTESVIEETALKWLKDNAIALDCDFPRENTLASLQDSLLPKLMRGEVRVKDVEG
jgi:hypothetical protein